MIGYSTRKGTNQLDQDQLQMLAKDIIDFGEIVEIDYYTFGTNRHSEDGEFEHFKDGGKCIVVQGFGFRYYIHFHGLKVTEILEEQITK